MGRKRKQYGRKNRKQNTGQGREQNTRNSVKKIRKKSLSGALHVRDVNSREIFKHKKLVCQFLRDYIPDFSYKVIRIHDYTNAQIREHENEMSLVIMLNRIQSPEDYSEFMKSSKEYMTKVLTDTPQELMNVLLEVFWALLMKMNVPQDEAQELVENMGVKNMGYLFANAEKMDIQAERRNTKEARERADAAETRADAAESLVRKMLGAQVRLCKKEGFTKDETRARLHEVYQVEESALDKYYEDIWQEN